MNIPIENIKYWVMFFFFFLNNIEFLKNVEMFNR